MQDISGVYAALQEPKKIVITTHQKPDGDAMGSSLGLYHFLTAGGHSVQVISPTNWADFLQWMPGVDHVLDFEKQTAQSEQCLADANFIFCLDFNILSRTKTMIAALEKHIGKLILIDHHQQPQTAAFIFGVSNTAKSSTCEMVYDFIVASPQAHLLNTHIATCLYTGMMTDTGSFRFPATTASVHRAVAHFMEIGINHTSIHSQIFDSGSEHRLRFLGHVLTNRMEVYYEYNTATFCITAADIHKFHIKTGDTEGLVNFLLSMAGIRFAAIVIDREGERKWSFRSKGDFDVNTFARTYFEGGGHFNAAGGRSDESLAATYQKFLAILPTFKNQLQ